MTDITISVAMALIATSISLLIMRRVPLTVCRTILYVGLGVWLSHMIGIRITAPVSPDIADDAGIVIFIWQVTALIPLMIRGVHRVAAEGWGSPTGG
jgi:hypothetical protein